MSRISGYRNSVKSEWRDRVWYEIADHARQTDGYILTLAGRAFLDRKVARRFGIDADRVIGVDLDKDVLDHNRKFKRTVIGRPLADVIAHFKRPIAAVNADLCTGALSLLTGSTIKAFTLSEWATDALLVLNVSVGRETQHIIKGSDGEPERLPMDRHTHRGLVALSYWTTAAMVTAWQNIHGKAEDTEQLYLNCWAAVEPIISEKIIGTESYVAHRQRMDSVIVKQFCKASLPFEDATKSRGHITAKMAHHTMRYGQ